MIKHALTYDDIQLVPAFSDIKSRQDIKLHTLLSRRYGLLQPLVAAPMDTVCGWNMAFKMFLLGGAGCIHRFMSIEEQAQTVRLLFASIYGEGLDTPITRFKIFDNWHSEIKQIPIMAAIGVHTDDKLRAAKLVKAGANVLVIDVAHGHHQNVVDMIKWCKDQPEFAHVDIIAGNIATAEGAYELEQAGADGLRVGIGGGSMCTTRIQTGFGVPNVTALENVVANTTVPVMADGGIRNSGDIAKALAIGAGTVMIGSLIAGTTETPGQIIETKNGLYKKYRGLASLETKTIYSQAQRNIEGESTMVPYKGGVKYIINNLLDGVKSALSYAGASSLHTYHPDYVTISAAGMAEAKPHLL